MVLTAEPFRVVALSGRQPYPRESARPWARGGDVPAEAETKRPSKGRGATPYCLPTVGLIVPVFGLALAPYWRSAGCRARHRARTLGAALDRYVRQTMGVRESTSIISGWRLINFPEAVSYVVVGPGALSAVAAYGLGAP